MPTLSVDDGMISALRHVLGELYVQINTVIPNPDRLSLAGTPARRRENQIQAIYNTLHDTSNMVDALNTPCPAPASASARRGGSSRRYRSRRRRTVKHRR